MIQRAVEIAKIIQSKVTLPFIVSIWLQQQQLTPLGKAISSEDHGSFLLYLNCFWKEISRSSPADILSGPIG